MVRLPVWLLTGLAILIGGGCCCQQRSSGSCHTRPLLALPPASRTHVEVQFRGGPLPPGDPSLLLPVKYRCLTPEQCRCRAVETQSMARMLDSQADSIARQSSGCPLKSCCQKRRSALEQDILRGTALELRNANAGAALNLFFRVVEAEALFDLTVEGLQVIGAAVAKTEDLKNKGFKSTEDVEAMKRQQLELQSDCARLQLALDEANSELIRMLELEDGLCQCKLRIWPKVQLHWPPVGPDCDASVAEGMAHRPELFVLQRVSDELDLCTLEVVRKMLSSLSPLMDMGSGKSIPCVRELLAILCGKGAMAEELETRRAQVEEHRATRMRTISSEIRQAVFALGRRAVLVFVAQERVRSWDVRLADLQEREKKGVANYVDVTEARLKWLKARGDVVKELSAWERELVGLCTHQGVLVKPCGPPTPDHELLPPGHGKVEPAALPQAAVGNGPTNFLSGVGPVSRLSE